MRSLLSEMLVLCQAKLRSKKLIRILVSFDTEIKVHQECRNERSTVSQR
jgi:hypothetical protein